MVVLVVQRRDVRMQVADLATGGGDARFEVVSLSSESQVGSPGPQHCDHRSDEHNNQDPQQWISDQ
ncbi:hypothetical protein [Streptomyces broussonetiae]|uniref:hypothetical protein n=1 Tax=Streptomyces broussonetiae TaxID=2686304 RepID=UPI001E44F40C|nr:hypothetical protein [Streptomyces broussonetiae]